MFTLKSCFWVVQLKVIKQTKEVCLFFLIKENFHSLDSCHFLFMASAANFLPKFMAKQNAIQHSMKMWLNVSKENSAG